MIMTEQGRTLLKGSGKELIADFVAIYYSLLELEDGELIDKALDTIQLLDKEEDT